MPELSDLHLIQGRISSPAYSGRGRERERERMDTIVKETTTDTLTVSAVALVELLEGASTHADKGSNAVHALNTVQIESEGAGYLVARATDRYRLIEGKMEIEYGQLSPSLIGLGDIKRVIAIAKEGKIGKVSLNRVGDLLTVSVSGNSITLTLQDSNFPPTAYLLDKVEREEVGEVYFNPAYMADYAKIAGKGNAVRVEFTGKAMLIHLPVTKVEWRALLMPMRGF